MSWLTFLVAWGVWFMFFSFLAGVYNQANIARNGEISDARKNMGAAITAWLILGAIFAGVSTFVISLF